MSKLHTVQDATGGILAGPDPNKRILSWFRGTPTASASGYEIGGLACDITNGLVYVNVGTTASATWDQVAVLDSNGNLGAIKVTSISIGGSGSEVLLAATPAEINRTSQVSTRLVTVAAATTTLTLTQALHENRTVVLGPTGGLVITPPAATGTGSLYRLVLGATVSGGNLTLDFKAGNASDVFAGVAITNKSTSTYSGWNAASNTNLITLDGSTMGGVKGDILEIQDIATNQWIGRIIGQSSGTVATPFSNH